MGRSKAKRGQVVYISAKVTKGMFPAERYFYVDIKPPITGYVTDRLVSGNAIRAVVVDVVEDGLIVALPGEVSRNNIVRVPLSLLQSSQA